MNWSSVGEYIKNNSSGSVALVGSLLTGNLPAAVAAGVSMVSDAAGTTNPQDAINALKTDPAVMVRLEELAQQERQQIRTNIADMERMRLEDEQAEHEQTQNTIRAGDKAEDPFVRRTRPAQSWLSLVAAIAYVFANSEPDVYILGALLTLPFSYAGLRGFDKFSALRGAKKAGSTGLCFSRLRR